MHAAPRHTHHRCGRDGDHDRCQPLPGSRHDRFGATQPPAHCTGVLRIVHVAQGVASQVHTGDCRYQSDMQQNAHLQRVRGACDLVLDTTYCNPQYTFPPQVCAFLRDSIHHIHPQAEVLEYCLHAVRAELFNGPRTLLVFGTYTIGKERLFLHVAHALQKQVYVNKAKMDILRCCQLDDAVSGLLTTDPAATNLHALPLFMVNFGKLAAMARQMPQYEVIVGFAPTGWSFAPRRGGQSSEGESRPAMRSQRGKIILYQVGTRVETHVPVVDK